MAGGQGGLTGVLGRLSTSRRDSRLEAVVQLGELRWRQGRFDEAAALLAQAELRPSAIAGRARLQMSGGCSRPSRARRRS